MSVTSSPGLLLLGFFGEKEAVAVLKHVCACSDTRQHALRAMWVDARKRRGGMMAKAGQPEMSTLPSDLEDHCNKIRSLERLQAGVDKMPFDIAMVEIELLNAYQAGVFLDRVSAAERAIPDPEDIQAVANVCLPLEARIDPSSLTYEKGPPLRVRTTNANARVQDYGYGDPHPDTALIPMVFLIGEAEPCVQVIEFKGRYFLRNGYHRLVGAMRRGVRRVPALVMRASKWEDVHAELGKGWFFDPRRLGAETPVLRHFGLASEIPLRVHETVTEFGWRSFPRPI